MAEHSRIEEFIDNASLELGGLDILINNAGVNKIDSIGDISVMDWDMINNINIRGPFILTNAISKIMITNGYGRIIN